MGPSGAALFARYAYPPNELGYCGPADATVLLGSDSARLGSGSAATERRIAEHARQFEGAWAYLEIIAAAAGVTDPLDARVVEAYWIGNELLDQVEPAALVRQLRERFAEGTGAAGANWAPGLPHHGFHVFAVYPWVGLLRGGSGNRVALSVLQRCRIRWGRVVAVGPERVRVRSRPLVLAGGRLTLGPPEDESPVWSVGGRSLIPADPAGPAVAFGPVVASGPAVAPGSAVAPGPDAVCGPAVGDLVAMHWDWVCDTLTPRQVAELTFRSEDQLARTNAVLCG